MPRLLRRASFCMPPSCFPAAIALKFLDAPTSVQIPHSQESSPLVAAMAALGGLLGAYGSDEEEEDLHEDQGRLKNLPLAQLPSSLALQAASAL